MKIKSIIQNTLVIVLSLTIIALSAGYSTFAIGDNSSSNKVQVKFLNLEILPETTINTRKLSGPTFADNRAFMSMSFILLKDEQLSFNVDVVNNGEDTVAFKDLAFYPINNENRGKYKDLTYKVTYADGSSIKEGDIIKIKEHKKLHVIVKVAKPVKDEYNVALALEMNYEQK